MRNPCCCCKSYTATDYVNATLVDTYLTTGPAEIAPYPRPSGFIDGDADPDCPGGSADLPACGPWPVAERPSSVTGDDVLHDWNIFTPSETATTVTICLDPGHRVAQTLKEWHGRLPWDFCVTLTCDTVTTRYRRLAISISVKRATVYYDPLTGPPQTGYRIEETGVYQATITVDRYSGKKTLSGCLIESTVAYPDGEPGGGFPEPWVANDLGTEDAVREIASMRFACAWDETEEECLCAYTSVEDGEGSHDVYFIRTTLNNYLASGNPSDIPGNTIVDAESHDATTLSGTVRENQETGDGMTTEVVDISEVTTFSFVLSEAYAATGSDSVASDAVALLNEIDLHELLWRPDTLRSFGVICKYHESTAQSPDIGVPECDYVDSSDYTGAMIGEPFNGTPDHMVGADHQTWRCYEDDGEHWEVSKYVAYAGENVAGDASDLLLQKQYSVWTENYPAGLLYPGSWWWWVPGSDNAPNRLMLQKQCHTTSALDSYNFFGPCGYKRHSPDVSKASCVTGWSGSTEFATGDTITLEDAIGDGTYDVIVFGGDNTQKRFSATVTGTSCVLGAEDVNARGVADAVAFWENVTDIDLSFGIVAKARDWKRSGVSFTPPAICGKVVVTGAVQDGSEVVLTVATLYTQIGDKIICVENDAADTVYANNGGAGFTLTAASNTELRYTGTLDAAWIGKYIKSLGAPWSVWNTTARRRNFVWQAWPNDATTGEFNTTPTNTDDHYSGTKILGCTPNVATDTDGQWATDGYSTGYGFPIIPDPTRCGGKSLVIPVDMVTHPEYQTPFSCGAAVTVCAPKVEAMTAIKVAAYVTAGAPALPDGCTFALPTTAPIPLGADCSTVQPIPHEASWNLCSPA